MSPSHDREYPDTEVRLPGRVLRTTIVLVLALAAVCAFSAPERVVVVGLDNGAALWLPAQATPAQQARAVEVLNRFQKVWARLFGSQVDLPDPLVVPASTDISESLFSALWLSASPSLAPEDRPAALGALRMILLDDPSAYAEALSRAYGSGRLSPSLAEGVLVYAFLQEETANPAFLPEALPPGAGARRLRAALARRGVSWDAFFNRFASWILTRAIDAGLQAPASGTLPAVWVLDSRLAPGAVSGWRFLVTDPAVAVSLEIAGEVPSGVRLFHVFTDDLGRPAGAGLCDLKGGPLVIPRRGKYLWVFIWNASATESLTSAALTLWSSYQAPFTVLGSSLHSGVLDLRLHEEAGVADYRLLGGTADQTAGSKILGGPFASEGEGEHHYRIPLQDPPGFDFRLSCRTMAGGSYSAALPPPEKVP